MTYMIYRLRVLLLTDGGENPVTRAYTPSELDFDEYGIAEVPVTLCTWRLHKAVYNYGSSQIDDADLSHTTLGLGAYRLRNES